jgi:hypothetical protein
LDTWTSTHTQQKAATWETGRSIYVSLICYKNSFYYFYFLWGKTNRKGQLELCNNSMDQGQQETRKKKKMDRKAVSQQKLPNLMETCCLFSDGPTNFVGLFSRTQTCPPLAAPAFHSAVKRDTQRQRDKQWNNVHHLIATWSLFIC